MNKILLLLILISSSIAIGQKPKFKDLKKDSLKSIQRKAEVLIDAKDKGNFKIVGVDGNQKEQNNYLKNYILAEKDTALIEIRNQKTVGFEKYQRCFFEISKIYQSIWEETAKKLYSKKFAECTTEEKEKINKIYPVRVF